jgi:CheY-like chemotaxis protein
MVSNGKLLMDRLHQTDNEKPDVIVLDLNMPLKNGFEALKEIKNSPSLSAIPVIILTASSNKQDEIRCLELGCNFFYTKPSTMNDYRPLATTVKRFIND